jgi:heptaprenyl diphosphate synthase
VGNNTKKLAALSLLTSLSLAVFVIESAIPPFVPIPGIKIGLANIVTLYMLFSSGSWRLKDSLLVLLARILLSSLIAGHPLTLVYSFTGGVLAFLGMVFTLKVFKKAYPMIISAAGGVLHNIGQISAAVFLLNNFSVIYYLPPLLISGIIAGLFNGFIIFYLMKGKHIWKKEK